MDRVAQVKCFVFPACLAPLALLVVAVSGNTLRPDPGMAVTHELGIWALRFLLITLALTPLRQLTGISRLIRFRRMMGLFSLFYATLHILSYLAFMLGWQWDTLIEDLYKRSYIIVGAMAASILIALGVTSTRAMMKRMGKSWSQLHRLVYPAAILVVVHFLWLVKSDYTEPMIYGAVLVVLLTLRLPVVRRYSWLNR